MNPNLILMCGLSFSGKSYLAQKISAYLDADIISLDQINQERGLNSNQFIPVEEWEKTSQITRTRLKETLTRGKNVIIDDTNPLLKLRRRFRKVADDLGLQTVVVYLDIPLEVIHERIKNNKQTKQRHLAPSFTLDNLIKMFEVPRVPEENVIVYKNDTNLEDWLKTNF
ncbi:ATP-binding protein [Patescibacteria group bacterium]|nr:ATP-binding protein [Patescibacteria group bacterium]